jgi:(4S)-4-hydroxy-5-phosphonooxypentane-2,3-dione isomerase
VLAMLVSVKIRPEMRERFLETIEDDALCSVRDEPGCLRFDVLQDEADENHYYFYEVYRDSDALAAHQQTPHYERWMVVRGEAVESVERTQTQTVFPRDSSYWG